jgi:5-methylcytosine-specific restriction endonuclease McrA
MIDRVVVLNADYSFLNIIDWKKAMCLIEKAKVEVVKYSGKVIQSIRGDVRVPVVLRLIKFVRTLYKARVPYSKKNIYVRDGYKCVYCGATDVKLTIDHVMPKHKGGKTSFENCVAACRPCNNRKGHKTCRDVNMFPKTKLVQPTISEFLMMRVKSLGLDKFIKEVLTEM